MQGSQLSFCVRRVQETLNQTKPNLDSKRMGQLEKAFLVAMLLILAGRRKYCELLNVLCDGDYLNATIVP
jgi:hypothetical protein